MYDKEYIKRITYGTPENIRIRQGYNRLNNRPLNYGMEDLFPNVNNYIGEPMTAINNINLSTPQDNIYIRKLKEIAQAISSNQNIDWRRLGNCFYDEFDNSGKLMQLGAENWINGRTWGGYDTFNHLLGGDYAERKQKYYNMLPEGYWRKNAESIDDALDAYARGKTGGWIAAQLRKYF